MHIVRSKLGSVGAFLVASLLMLRGTGSAPPERNAFEVFQPRPQFTRGARKKNLDSATQQQWAKYYRGRWDEKAQKHVAE